MVDKKGEVRPIESRKDAVLRRVASMKLDERLEVLDALLLKYCLDCATPLDPDGDCPNEDCVVEELDDEDEDDDDDEDDEDDDEDDDDDEDEGDEDEGDEEPEPS